MGELKIDQPVVDGSKGEKFSVKSEGLKVLPADQKNPRDNGRFRWGPLRSKKLKVIFSSDIKVSCFEDF
ncbi:hypothetical protein COB11_04780 [Candidatus Aerophobetes bacterium]|uniref:Uncharacterized protein n=1 Tax=Aerophobetes bacterium TaxID=2030807 RepID=A0A2A4YGH4_UNCAE|nr:MAG: hypothetical protein COB11_04780 [Candidatus Aerophobetes bacterium]